jgi:tRNA threonylcarbamoyladenosine biosynthesis protein TsaB
MILALKTADATTQIWLFADPQAAAKSSTKPPKPTAHITWDSGRDLSDQLLARILSTLTDAGHQLSDLTAIAIFAGPGSFTSLRIGHTTANALADSLGIPVVGAQNDPDTTATGEDWLTTALAALPTAKPGRSALPHYGSEAHITRPKS